MLTLSTTEPNLQFFKPEFTNLTIIIRASGRLSEEKATGKKGASDVIHIVTIRNSIPWAMKLS